MQQIQSPERQTTMAAINVQWSIKITSDSVLMGSPICTSSWDVLSKLAEIKARIPSGWQAEAYPQVSPWITPTLASAPVAGMIYPPVTYSHTRPVATMGRKHLEDFHASLDYV